MDADEWRARRRAYYAGMYNGVICPYSYALLILILIYSCPRPDTLLLLPLILEANKVEINRKSRESSRLNPNRDAIIKRSRDSYAAKQSASRESNSALDGHRPSCEVPSPNVHGPDGMLSTKDVEMSMQSASHASYSALDDQCPSCEVPSPNVHGLDGGLYQPSTFGLPISVPSTSAGLDAETAYKSFNPTMLGCTTTPSVTCMTSLNIPCSASPPYAPSHNAPSSAFLPIPTKQVSHTSGGLYERVSMSRNKRTQLSQLHDKRLLVLPKVPPCKYCGVYKFYRETAHFCCSAGQVSLASTVLPECLTSLLTGTSDDSKDFQTMICTYNNHLAYISMSIHCDVRYEWRNDGIYTVRVQGQICLFLGDLLPPKQSTKILGMQFYFYDPEHQTMSRSATLPRLRASTLRILVGVMDGCPYSPFLHNLSTLDNLDRYCIVIKTDIYCLHCIVYIG
ncbi:hypothetical protein LIER_17027 [Lithospermum erythrorhizon]|uniref:Uncharacterized protein n=1 Tax=Lithospermum erythrorhizon TaxID=34254 RepID=A0AAV3QB67_LITER